MRRGFEIVRIKIDVQMRLSACLFNELLLYSDAYHSGRRKKLTNKRLNKPNQNKTKKIPMNSKQSDVFQIESIDLVYSCYRIVKWHSMCNHISVCCSVCLSNLIVFTKTNTHTHAPLCASIEKMYSQQRHLVYVKQSSIHENSPPPPTL